MAIDKAEIEQKKSALIEEKSKPEPDPAIIASLMSEIIEAEQALKTEAATRNSTVSSGRPNDGSEKEAQLEAAVESSRAFLEKDEVTQVRNVAAALSDETGKTVVTKSDIDTMKTNSRAIVDNEDNQKEHKQRQEMAQDLKTALNNPNLSEAERSAKEAQRETLVEAIGAFKEAETVSRKEDLMKNIAGKDPQAALKKTTSTEATTEQPTLTPEQEKALKKETFLLNNALDKGEITQSEFDQKMKEARSPKAAPALGDSNGEMAAIMSKLSETGIKGGADVIGKEVTSSSRTPAQPVATEKSSGRA